MLEELLQIILEGAQGQPAQQPQHQKSQHQQAANPWLEILEGVLGGVPQNGQQSQAGPGLGDILEIVLGGGSASTGQGRQNRQKSPAGPIGGNPMLAPFTQALAERLGISPQMASIIISAAVGLLMSKMKSAVQSGQLDPRSGAAGLSMNDVLGGNLLASSGVTTRVAQQTGLNEMDIERSLREALEILGVRPDGASAPAQPPKKAAPAKPKAQPKPSAAPVRDLKHLLDTWKIDG